MKNQLSYKKGVTKENTKYSRVRSTNVKHSYRLWKGIVVADYIKTYKDTDAEKVYKYMETFLGESVKTLWEAYMSNFPQEFQALVNMGANPYNFTNKIHNLITGKDPNSGLIILQSNALIKLEQLSITS